MAGNVHRLLCKEPIGAVSRPPPHFAPNRLPGVRAQVDVEMAAEVAKLGIDRDMVVDSQRKRQQNKVRPAGGGSLLRLPHPARTLFFFF